MTYLLYAIGLIIFFYSWFSLAPWVPTDRKDLGKINTIAKLKSRQTFLEIGCGNARVCSYIARKNPNAKVIGIELSPVFYLMSKIRVALCGPRNLNIIFGNALKHDISHIDILYTYALPKSLNTKVKEQLIPKMKKNARLISYAFTMEEWKGKQQHFKASNGRTPITVYQK